MFTRVSLLAAVLLAVAMMGAPAARADVIWNLDNNGNWDTAANPPWSTGAIPTAADTVVFQNAGVTAGHTITLGAADNASIVNVTGSYNWTWQTGQLSIATSFNYGSTGTGSIFSGTLAGGGALNVTAGVLRLDGANSYTGGTTLGSAGKLIFNNATALGAGTGTFTINGGSMDITPAALTLTNNNPLTVNGTFTFGSWGSTGLALNLGTGAVSLGTAAGTTRTITVAASYYGTTRLTLGGNITNGDTATGLIKAGDGTLILNGAANAYTGATTISAGVLQFGSLASIGGSGASVTANSPAVAAAGYAIDQAFLGRIVNTSTGVVALAVDSPNDLNFSNTGGGANLTAARLGANATCTYSGTLTPNGTTYRLGGGGGTLTMANALTDASGPVTRSLDVSETGTVVLPVANSYSGTTTVGATGNSTLTIGNNGSLGSADGTTATGTTVGGNQGALYLQGGITVTNELLTLNPSNAGVTVSSRSGGTNTWAGNIVLTTTKGATFSTAVAGSPLTITGDIGLTAASGTFSFSIVSGGAITVNGVISGPANVSGSGGATGLVVLSGLNTYTGTTSMGSAACTFSINTIRNIGVACSLGQPTTVANGTISLGGSGAVGTLLYTGSGDSTDRVINLSGTSYGAVLDQSGAGPLKFTNDLTASVAGAKTLTLQGSTAGTGEFGGVIQNSITPAATIAVTKAGTGTWTLSNAANTYTGVTTVNGGILSFSSLATEGAGGGTASGLGASGNAAANLVLDNKNVGTATLQYTGAAASTDRLFTIGSSTAIAGAGVLDASGAGAVNFTNTGAIAFGAAAQTRALTLTGTNTGNNILAAIIGNNTTSATSLTKSGVGTWVLAAGTTETYTGATTISLGLLKVDGTLNAASAVAVNATDATHFGSLGGTGIVGVVTVAQYAHLAPGDSPGTLHTGNLNFQNGAVYDWEYGTGSPTDLVAVTGTLTFGLTATLNIDPAAPAGTYNLFSYTAGSPVNPTWTFAGQDPSLTPGVNLAGGLVTLTLTAVPEPATLGFLAVGGLGLIGASVRRRTRKA